jgi:hypothetical protein
MQQPPEVTALRVFNVAFLSLEPFLRLHQPLLRSEQAVLISTEKPAAKFRLEAFLFPGLQTRTVEIIGRKKRENSSILPIMVACAQYQLTGVHA